MTVLSAATLPNFFTRRISSAPHGESTSGKIPETRTLPAGAGTGPDLSCVMRGVAAWVLAGCGGWPWRVRRRTPRHPEAVRSRSDACRSTALHIGMLPVCTALVAAKTFASVSVRACLALVSTSKVILLHLCMSVSPNLPKWIDEPRQC